MRKGLGVLLVLVVGAGVLMVVVDGDESEGDVVFEVLRMDGAFEAAGTLRAATTQAGFDSLWNSAALEVERPEVDFTEQVVVSITIPDDACPPELIGFERDGDTITPVFVEPGGDCPEPYLPKTFIVALDRAPLEPGFRLLLPGQEVFDFGDSSTAVRLDPPTPVPGCDAIESFADQLDETGITVDYSPTSSPEELLTEDAIALRGTLTGGFVSTSTSGDDGLEEGFVAYEVEVEEWLFTGRSFVDLPERQYVSLFVSPTISVSDHADVARDAAGSPVVVVSYLMPNAPGYVAAGEEGFATSCEGGPLLGRTGFQGEWAEIETLDQLSDALRG